MQEPKSISFLDPLKSAFQTGKIDNKTLLEIMSQINLGHINVVEYTGLSKHMSTPTMNIMAQRLCDMNASENPDNALRSDGLPRSFAQKQFERYLDKDKDKFLNLMLPFFNNKERETHTLPLINFNHLQAMLPALQNAIKFTIDNIATPHRRDLEVVKNKMSQTTNDEELKKLLKDKAELEEKIAKCPHEAINTIIAFNIIKPYVTAHMDQSLLKNTLYKTFNLDKTLIEQLYEKYRSLPDRPLEKHKSFKNEAMEIPTNTVSAGETPKNKTPEGPARNTLRR